MLTNEEIQEFKKITYETKGLKLNDEQALDQGLRLVVLFELILKNDRSSIDDTVATSRGEVQNKNDR